MYSQKDTYIFDCDSCSTRCDGNSKLYYNFENDVVFAERHEQLIIDKINARQEFVAKKTLEHQYPDISVLNIKGDLQYYVEVKAQRRTFMTVNSILKNSSLSPSETVALNLSDLKRYIAIQSKIKTPISIVWVVMNRPCIVPENQVEYFFQKVSVLEAIFKKHKNSRRFRRRTGKGDIVNGIHKGVVVNYHFSLQELIKWKTND